MKLKWTEQAHINLETIYDFITLQNPAAAIKIYNLILEEVEILIKFPYLAPIEPILKSEPECFRGLIIVSGKFKVIYYIENEFIYITHLWDCRRNPETLKKISKANQKNLRAF